MNLPVDPTPAQLRQIVQAIIRANFEPDGVVSSDVEATEDGGWTVRYKTKGRDFELSYNDGNFLKGPVGAEGVADFSEGDEDPIDRHTEQLRAIAGPIVDGWIEQVKAVLDEAGDLASFSEKLLTLYPDLEGDRLRKVMSDATLVASLAGANDGESVG